MKAKTTKERGYGWKHEQQRERLLQRHRDGAPCWWCNQPMFKDKNRNFDGQALNADHSRSIATGGTTADRLLHGSCNKSRGDGSRDAYRPALGGTTPEPTIDQSSLGVRAMPWPDWP